MMILRLSRIFFILVVAMVSSALSQEDNTVQVLKCCPENFIFGDSGCAFNDSVEVEIPVYTDDHVTRDPSKKVDFVNYQTECITDKKEDIIVQLDVSPSDTFFLQNDGRLWLPQVNASFSNRHFCVDSYEGVVLIAIVCVPGLTIEENRGKPDIVPLIGMAVSLPFLLATFLIYALLPDRNLYGKCLMSYVFALFWSYFILIYCYIYGHYAIASLLTCQIMGTAATFFFLSAFFWMNVIAFDIWLTFSGNNRTFGNETKRFWKYSIYAWGMSTLLIIVITALNLTVDPSLWYSPYGGDCWFQEGLSMILYFYSPMAILLALNFSLFVATAWKIIKAHKETAILRQKGNETSNSKRETTGRFKIYLKLMFAMGVNWLTELVQYVITWQIGPIPALYYITDTCNAGLGVIIFFMFVFNRSTWKLLKKRYYMATGKAPPTQRTTSVQMSSKSL